VSAEKKIKDEELGPRMSIREHLEELRRRVIRAAVAVLVVFLVSWFFRDYLMTVLLRPHYQAITSLRTVEEGKSGAKIVAALQQENPSGPAAKALAGLQQILEQKSFPAAIEETRARFEQPEAVAALDQAERRYEERVTPLLDQRPIVTGYTESIATYIKACLVVSLLVAGPVVLWQIWGFIGAGLYKRERSFLRKNFPLALLLFGAGLAFGYFLLIPTALSFLANFGSDFVRQEFRISQYFSFFWTLTFVLGAVFQIPVVMVIFSHLGIIHPGSYRRQWRYVFLGCFVVAAIVTPTPDPLTQALVAFPMYGLFEFGILLARLAYRDRQKILEQSAISP